MARINAGGGVDNGLGALFPQQERKFTLTAAQINSMFTTPITVLPAVPGYVCVIDLITIQFKPGTVQFTGGGAVSLVYHGGAVSPHASSIPAATITSATGSISILPPTSAVIVAPVNTGVDITNATAVFATGNGTAVVKIHFWMQLVD